MSSSAAVERIVRLVVWHLLARGGWIQYELRAADETLTLHPTPSTLYLLTAAELRRRARAGPTTAALLLCLTKHYYQPAALYRAESHEKFNKHSKNKVFKDVYVAAGADPKLAQ